MLSLFPSAASQSPRPETAIEMPGSGIIEWLAPMLDGMDIGAIRGGKEGELGDTGVGA
ncbi:MAG: hypothetical protein ABI607_05345 [Betaproteobacteria bacterium]